MHFLFQVAFQLFFHEIKKVSQAFVAIIFSLLPLMSLIVKVKSSY